MGEVVAVSRRAVLAGMATIGVATIAVPVSGAMGTATEALADDVAQEEGVQYGFLVHAERCTGCEECVAACRRANHTPESNPARRKVVRYEAALGRQVYISTSCMHCAEPACEVVCPAGAISKGAGGIVTVNHERCIGCKYCFEACPFGVPHYSSNGMDKCDCCLEAGIELGNAPNCVQACKFRALHYGNLEELMAATQGRAKQIECETGPSLLVV